MKWHVTFVVLSLLGCAGEMVCRRPNGPPTREDCVQALDPGAAAVMGGANAALWASGNGCQLSGCHPTLVCNQRSGLCERPLCGEGRDACPLGTMCNSTTQRCQ